MPREVGTGSTSLLRADTARLCWPTLLLIVAIVTLLNAIKPLTVDDAAYAEYARQIAAHPTDPYGFQVFWSQWPEPANWLLAPPVLLYWWAIAIQFFGPSVFVWKLWLLPWIAAFVFGVHALLRRFAPSVALPMTVFTAFAPVYLPAINYMLDVPALGLGLLALSVAMRGIDRKSIGLIALSGVMFGVALQTKYTVVTLPAVAAVYGFTRRRYLLPVIPGIIAIAVFAAWECFVSRTYGQSHFLLHLHGPDLFEGKQPRIVLLLGTITLFGSLAAPLAVLMAQSFDVSSRWIFIAVILIIAAFAVVTFEPWAIEIFGLLGVAVLLCTIRAVWVLVAREPSPAERPMDAFLLVWLGVELAAFIALSPFEATRRLMGILLVLTLVTARLLDRSVVRASSLKTMRWLVAFGVATGCGFGLVDGLDARAERTGAEWATALIARNRLPGQHAFYRGHWGFQYYCERGGLQPLVPDHTQLLPGDWVVFPSINSQRAGLALPDIREVATRSIDDPLKLETLPTFYGRGVAIDYRDIPRLKVIVYQVTAAFIPPTTYAPQMLVDWATGRRRPLMPLSTLAVLRAAHYVDPASVAAVQQAIAASGVDTLREASHDPDPYFRNWAIAKLNSLHPKP